MATVYAKLTSKGQITLPISLRNAWDLKPGDQIAFDIKDSGKASITPKKRQSILDNIEHLTIRSGQKLSNAEHKTAVEDAAIDRFEKSRRQGRE